MSKLRWGVLGVAKIATAKVIPAMQGGELTEVTAIASRDAAKARAAADELGIARAYGSYEELLGDPDIDAVYNPLPNHLHKPWTIAAAERGKHVLCEKPLALNAAEAVDIIAARDRTGVKMQEAFMVWTHPQWRRAVEICRSGRLGALRSYTGHFSYFNDDPDNIRNFAEMGGGALMDIGCYLLTTSRMIFGEEPRRVLALIERDPQFNVDALTSMVLDYPSGQAIGTCSTRMIYHQRVQVYGTEGRLEIEIPFNAPRDRPCRLWVDNEGDLTGATVETIEVDTCDQFRIQGDEFSRAVIDDTEVPYPLEMSLANMKLIDALFRSARSGRWEKAE
ncbi:MAG: Gfo/Idh/MocA family oxidoreductase [Acidobacteriota bacterium]|jgi:predicted dehydrogenase